MKNMEVRGTARARWLAASLATAVVVSFTGTALGQAAAGGNVGAGAGNAGAVGAGGNIGVEANPGNAGGNTPVPMPGANPDVNLNMLANATGEIKSIDKDKRSVTMDNGDTYFLATNFDINTLKTGQRVRLSYNLEGTERRIVKIDPPQN